MLNDYEPELEEVQNETSVPTTFFTDDFTEIYKLHPPPPQISFQQLITQYKANGESKYFLWFLHRYEPHINKISMEAATYYAVMERWQDLKAEIIATLWEAVQSYEPSSDPAAIYQLAERDKSIYAAFQSLFYHERLIVSSHLGFGPHCFTCHTKDGTPIPKQSFRTIAIFHKLKEKAVSRIYTLALKKIRQSLELSIL